MSEGRIEELTKAVDKLVLEAVSQMTVERIYDDTMNLVRDEIRRTYGVLPKVIEVHSPSGIHKVSGLFHDKFEVVLKLVAADLPVYLSGSAGSGKNVMCQQIAESLDLPFYFTNAVTQEYRLTGFIDAGGVYHETQFYKAFKDGGVFFLDELDASIPEVLVLLNAAIANRYFDFPNGRIDASPDFRVIAAGNTFGNGATNVYSGRYCLDGASMDRFNIVKIDYSEQIEMGITENNTELIEFCHSFRKFVDEAGIKCIFSYRALNCITKLEGQMPLEDILEICLVKGLSEDDIKIIKNGIELNKDNKYYKAFCLI